MRKQGKEFELLVKDLEIFLKRYYGQSLDRVRTKWRYRVKGKHSGRFREVDVAFLTNDGPRTIFIAIECRDRKGRQGVSWIEELATKKRDIEANLMVAVSRDGFTQPAINLAVENDIELRTLSDISTSNTSNALMETTLVKSHPTEVRILSFSWSYRFMSLTPMRESPEFSRSDIESITAGFEQGQWFDTVKRKEVSLKEIINGSLTWDKLLGGVSTEGQPIVRQIKIDLKHDHYRLNRVFPNNVLMALASVQGDFEVRFLPERIPADRVLQYRSKSQKPVVELHEFDGKHLKLDGQKIIFAYVADENIKRQGDSRETNRD